MLKPKNNNIIIIQNLIQGRNTLVSSTSFLWQKAPRKTIRTSPYFSYDSPFAIPFLRSSEKYGNWSIELVNRTSQSNWSISPRFVARQCNESWRWDPPHRSKEHVLMPRFRHAGRVPKSWPCQLRRTTDTYNVIKQIENNELCQKWRKIYNNDMIW